VALIFAPENDQVVHLRVSWDAYEALSSSVGDRGSALLSFDGEILEIMSPGSKHERIANRIAYLLSAVVVEWCINLEETGSTTFKSAGGRGFEADKSYYIQNAAKVRDFDALDLAIDPSPDLVVEVDITNRRTDKSETYASMGIPEFWRYREDRLEAFAFTDRTYTRIGASRVIGGLPIVEIEKLLKRSGTRLEIVTDWSQWLKANIQLHEA
jgi:Uma2 family endonuclease